eukprot:TRINITY_DN3864_c0_g2_i7.p1 TRINITY_DN3864_c0_g2~~TRINITY_DN3864_c0_g2_i7.p1  ORF type:complete len:938 (-),score=237.67 TRINITY_DN3864_c0_g2_i7:371-3184(-)
MSFHFARPSQYDPTQAERTMQHFNRASQAKTRVVQEKDLMNELGLSDSDFSEHENDNDEAPPALFDNRNVYHSEYSQHQEELDSLTTLVNRLKEENKDLTQKCVVASRKATMLQNRFIPGNSSNIIEGDDVEISELREENKLLKENVQSTSNDVSTLRNRVQELNNSVASLTLKNKELEDSQSQNCIRCSSLPDIDQLNNLQRDHTALQAEFQATITKLESALAESNESNKLLEDELQSVKDTLEMTDSDLSNNENEMKTLHSQYSATCEELKSITEELDDFKSRCDLLENELKTRPSIQQTIPSGRSEDNNINEELHVENEELKNHINELESLLSNSSENVSQLNDAKMLITELESNSAACREKYELEKQDLVEKHNELDGILKNKCEALVKAESRCSTLQDQLSIIENSSEKGSVAIEALRSELVKSNERNTTLEIQINKVQSELDNSNKTFNAQISEIEEELKSANELNVELESQLMEMSSQLEQVGSRAADVESRLVASKESLSKTTTSLQSVLDDTKRELEEEKAKSQSLENDLVATKAELSGTMKGLENERKNSRNLREERNNSKLSLQSEITSLEKQMHDLAVEVSAANENAAKKDHERSMAEAKMRETQEQAAKTITAVKAKARQDIETIKSRAKDEMKRVQQQLKEQFKAKQEKRHKEMTQVMQNELSKIKQQTTAQNAAIRQSLQESHQKQLNIVMNECNDVKSSLMNLRSVTQTQIQDLLSLISHYNSRALSITREHDAELNRMTIMYQKENLRRKHFFNMVQELKGNIRVFCRCRPQLGDEKALESATQFPASGDVLVRNNKNLVKKWEFDQVFSPKATNDTIFKDVEPLVTSVIDGYNACIFAYGQTGSGKTHTMEGTVEDRGINFRSLERLFDMAESRGSAFEMSIKVSMLEIYNEQIIDLLDDGSHRYVIVFFLFCSSKLLK